MTFKIKKWLDTHIVPLITEKPLSIHSFLWRDADERDTHKGRIVHVWLLADPEVPFSWGLQCSRLILEEGWCFDYLRDAELAQVNGQQVQMFGGNGAPMFGPSHMVSTRLFKELGGDHCILQVGLQLDKPERCADATKFFYSELGDNPLEAVQKYSAKWGAA